MVRADARKSRASGVRLTHNMDPIDLLRQQIEDWVAQSRVPSEIERSVESIKALWKEWEASGISAPADLESAARESHAVKILDDIMECLRSISPNFDGNIIFMTIPQRDYEAFARPFGAKRYLIAVDTLLPGFLSFSCFAAVATAFERPSEDQVDRFTKGMLRQFDMFLKVLEPDTDDELFLEMVKRNYEGSKMASFTLTSVLTFLLSHEAAHILLGHTESSPEGEVGEHNASPQDEFDADALGLKIYQELTKNPEIWPTVRLESLYDAVPLFLFDLLELYEARFEQIHGHPYESKSHPHSRERRAKLLEDNPGLFHERSLSLYEGLKEFAEHIREQCVPPAH